MPLDVLSSIKGANPSKAVEELFINVKNAVSEIEEKSEFETHDQIMTVEVLREDKVNKSPEDEIEIIKRNFPLQKDSYLVVPRVIEE